MLHAVPNVWRPALVYSMADIVLNIMLLATLSYLGVGVQPPQAEWGVMVSDGRSDLLNGAIQQSVCAGLLIVLAVVSFNIVGERLAARIGAPT